MLKWFRRRRVLIARIKELELRLNNANYSACVADDALCQGMTDAVKDAVWGVINATSDSPRQFSVRAYCDGLKERRRADA